MTVLNSLPGVYEDIDSCFEIKFSGRSKLLQAHQIGLDEYLASLRGYNGFVVHIGKSIFNVDVEVSIVGEGDGSFKSTVRVVCESVGFIGSVLGIFSFFEVTPRDIASAFSAAQTVIVDEYKRHKGDLSDFVDKVMSSDVLSEEDKMKLIRLFLEEDFRESLDSFTSPLDTVGYEDITVSSKDFEIFKLKKVDRDYFKFISPESEKNRVH